MTRPQDEWAALALGTRTGLPEELRVLLEAYPRAEWRGHANFDDLTAFWLERHLGFRQLLSRIRENTQSAVQGDLDAGAFAKTLHRNVGSFVGELHLHHNVEDAHYFPMLAARERRLARGFELLDRDHAALERALGRLTEETQDLLRALPAGSADRDVLCRYRDRISAFDCLLDRHLLDEEEIVIPTILEHRRSL